MSGSSGSRIAGAVVVAVVVAACSVATGLPGASPTTESQPPSTLTQLSASAASATPSPTAASQAGPLVAEADGMSLTVTLDRTTVAPGETIFFSATFHNGSAAPMDYSVPWCGGAASTSVSVALPEGPVGKRWSGIAQVFKDYVLTEAYGPGGVPALQPVVKEVPAQPCQEDQDGQSGLLGPGKSITSSMPWKAEIVRGVGALAGTVPFTVTVGYDQQNGPPSYPPGYTGIRGSWVAMFKQLSVSGTLVVVGEGKPWRALVR